MIRDMITDPGGTGRPEQPRTARQAVFRQGSILRVDLLYTIEEVIRELLADENRELLLMKQELTALEQASLYARFDGHSHRFTARDDRTGKETGITRDMARVHRLARREYLQQRIRETERFLKPLENALQISEKSHSERIPARLRKLRHAGLDLCRILFTEEQNRWMDQPYTPNPFHPENLKNPTSGGVLMRSKSEAELGTMLEELGLPYRYDDRVLFRYDPHGDPSARPSKETCFADFKIPNLLGGITVHEHFGAFHVEHYADNALKRMNDYHQFSVYEMPDQKVRHEEFTWSFECDLQDPVRRKKLLRRILFPRVW